MRRTINFKAVLAGVLIAAVGSAIVVHVVRRANAVPAGMVVSSAHFRVSTHHVLPTQANRSVTGPNDPSIAMAGPRSRSNGLLVVFLPGTGGKPACCQLFLREAVSLGYHAIGLTYNNDAAVGSVCLNDLGCFGLVRRNRFDGTSPSAYSSLPPQDGIASRLTAVLSYLRAHYPHEGWGSFVRRGAPVWSHIVVAGHSQGGGEAAFIGTIRRLRGVITLSSPPDTNLSRQPATWVAEVPHGLTPIDRMVGFVHSGDPFYPRIAADWQAMDLGSLGPLTSVDDTRPPYHHTHELLSSAPLPLVVLAQHDSTAVDSATPACANGSPRYAPVWEYMLEVAGGLRVTSGGSAC